MEEDRVARFLGLMRSKGVRVWTAYGRLHYEAPKGTLSAQDIETLRALKTQVVALLQMTSPAARATPRPERRPSGEPIPLTFSQLWEWSVLESGRCSSSRAVARALRLVGPLDVGCLKQVFVELAHRHEALRTRIVAEGPAQIVAVDDRTRPILEVVEAPAGAIEVGTRLLVEAFVHEPIDVSEAPLFAGRLVRIGEHDHVLVGALDHLISDGVSLEILLRDLWSLYAREMRGALVSLPDVSIQYADYAVWQRSTDAAWREQHDAYWAQRLGGARHLWQFMGAVPERGERITMGVVRGTIDDTLTEALRSLSRSERTTLVMVALTAFVALLLRWCDETDLVVIFMSAGRQDPEVANTVGYFAAPLYLRIELREADRLCDVLKRVTAEYASALDHADSGRIAVQTPRPDFVWNPRFNWLTRRATSEAGREPHPEEAIRDLRRSTFEFSPRQDIERGGGFELVLSETEERIRYALWYRVDRFSLSTVDRFERGFRSYLAALVRDPTTRLIGVSPP